VVIKSERSGRSPSSENAYKVSRARNSRPMGKTDPDPSSTPAGEEAPGRGKSGTFGSRYLEKHSHIRGRGLLSSAALGLSDGLVTNVAFLTGFAGATSDTGLIRFAGVAALLAGAVSMFFGGVLAARSEHDLFEADARREGYEIQTERDEEVAELTELYEEKGLTPQEASMVVTRISGDKDRFLEDMLVNELHIHRSSLNAPYKQGAVIGLSFLLGALVPLLPYFLFSTKEYETVASLLFSFVFLFSAGIWKGSIVSRKVWRSGLETLLIGAVAAGILFLIGSALTFV